MLNGNGRGVTVGAGVGRVVVLGALLLVAGFVGWMLGGLDWAGEEEEEEGSDTESGDRGRKGRREGNDGVSGAGAGGTAGSTFIHSSTSHRLLCRCRRRRLRHRPDPSVSCSLYLNRSLLDHLFPGSLCEKKYVCMSFCLLSSSIMLFIYIYIYPFFLGA